MIATSEALPTFERLLAEAGFDHNRPDPLLAWAAFKSFAQLPVECAEDGLLFACGTFDFTGERLFQLSFTRQFSHEEDGDYAGMEQLTCTIYYAPAAELVALATNQWSLTYASPGEFFTKVEAMPEFRIPTSQATPLRAEVDQEDV